MQLILRVAINRDFPSTTHRERVIISGIMLERLENAITNLMGEGTEFAATSEWVNVPSNVVSITKDSSNA